MATSYSATHHGQVPSTQDLARESFDGRAVLVTAAEQTAGRGRGGAHWVNADRAIAMSLAFRAGWRPGELTIVPLLAGLAAADVLAEVDLKWPNDVLLDGDKVAGILAELFDGVVVVGMGVNLWWPSSPEGATGLHDEDPGPEAGRDLAERWATRLLHLVDLGPDDWPIDRYRSRCVTLGSRITWEPDGEGVALDIQHDGGLMVETESGRVILTTAGVRHVRAVGDS